MKHFLAVFAVLLALVATVPVVAQEPQPSAPTVTLTAEQFQALIAKTVAGPAVQVAAIPAAVAPAAAPVAAPVKAAAISEEGVFGLSWGTILAGLASLLVALFAALKGATALKVRKMIQLAAETGWLVAERVGSTFDLTGAQKAALALGEFLKVFSAEGLPVPPGAVATAQTIFTSKSAAAGLAPIQAPPAADLAAAKAAADSAAKLAAGATAGQLAEQAAK